ncbi:MAG TPA: FHA domain-containing protein [Candidatus Binataceae bacterium]|nr:FHA domain-containing protein [Candidatus Binataceae bacterium]
MKLMNQSVDRRELWFKAMAGLAGGVIGWAPIEIVSHGHSLNEVPTAFSIWAGTLTSALLGGLIGGLILAFDGKTLEVTPHAQRRFLRAFLICFVLAAIGSRLSDRIFSDILAAGGWSIGQNGSLEYLILARVTGWTLIGLMLGIGVGLASFSVENIAKGAIGGAIGGFTGGILFDFVGFMTQTGLLSRLIGFAGIGLAIGLFIGLVQELTKTAWMTVEAGRLRGRQFRLEGATAMIGRAEENNVGLFGDNGVQPRHAVIERKGNGYTLRNLAVAQGTTVNGSRVETVELHDGDQIGISNYEMVFHERVGAQASQRANLGLRPPTPMRSQTEPTRPVPSMPENAAASSGEHAGNGSGAYLMADDGQRYTIKTGSVMRLGRALDNDVVINHASVSRHHAEIEGSGRSYRIRDLGSQNGTFVDGSPVTEATVGDGAKVKLGDAVLTFFR